MKTAEILALCGAAIAVYLIARKVTGKTTDNGWTDKGGTRIDPQGNYWQGGQMIWRAPGLLEAVGQGGALTQPVWI